MKTKYKILTPILGCATIGATAAVPCVLNNSNNVVYTTNTTSPVLNDCSFDVSHIMFRRTKTAYAWKRYDCTWRDDNYIDTLNTTFDVDFDSTEQKKHWDVTEYDLDTNENEIYKKYWLKQNTSANNNLRAILMQFEIATFLPGHTALTFESNISIAGKLHINGYWDSSLGCACVESEISDFSDSDELNITPGNIWNKDTPNTHDKYYDIKDHLYYKGEMSYGDKNIALFAEDPGFFRTYVNKKFNWSKNQTVTIANNSSGGKIFKKYFNVYLLTSATYNKCGNHHLEATDLFVKFTNPTLIPFI